MNEVQLTPVGVFPHSRGFQQVDAPALAALVKNFNSFFARLGRRFAGIPFYIGHPDVPGYENIYPDRKAYGWIMELEARDDGLYARPKWSKAGQELIENGHYKFLSPYWEAANIGSKDGKPLLRPTVLISVGLTNQPNIPVLPLANNTELESMPLVGMSLPLSIDSESPNRESQIVNRESSPRLESLNRESQIVNSKSASSPTLESSIPNSEPDSRLSSLESTIQQLETRNQELETATRDLSPRLESPNRELEIANRKSAERLPQLETELQARLSTLEISNRESEIANRKSADRLTALENANEKLEIRNQELSARLCTVVLANALADARLLPAERDYWLHQLESNFEAASLALANAQPKLNRHSRTDNLPIINTPTPNGKTRTDQILTLVNERMRVTGQPFHQSWIETKKHHPTLFQ